MSLSTNFIGVHSEYMIRTSVKKLKFIFWWEGKFLVYLSFFMGNPRVLSFNIEDNISVWNQSLMEIF